MNRDLKFEKKKDLYIIPFYKLVLRDENYKRIGNTMAYKKETLIGFKYVEIGNDLLKRRKYNIVENQVGYIKNPEYLKKKEKEYFYYIFDSKRDKNFMRRKWKRIDRKIRRAKEKEILFNIKNSLITQ